MLKQKNQLEQKNLNIIQKKIMELQKYLLNQWSKKNGLPLKKLQKKLEINQYIILFNGDIY